MILEAVLCAVGWILATTTTFALDPFFAFVAGVALRRGWSRLARFGTAAALGPLAAVLTGGRPVERLLAYLAVVFLAGEASTLRDTAGGRGALVAAVLLPTLLLRVLVDESLGVTAVPPLHPGRLVSTVLEPFLVTVTWTLLLGHLAHLRQRRALP